MSVMKIPKSVEEYLSGISPEQRKWYEKIKKMVHKIEPEMTEGISYGIPTFFYKDKYVLYFAGFKDHMSIYPVTDNMVEPLGKELEKFRSGRGTLHFTSKDPIPDHLLESIIRFRLATRKK